MKEKVDATRTESPMGRAAPMERTDPNDRPSGPPRLNLAGGKPSWRDREAAKGAAGDSASGSSPAGPSSGGAPLSRGRS
jgi:translation initiation factor 3 subunit A